MTSSPSSSGSPAACGSPTPARSSASASRSPGSSAARTAWSFMAPNLGWVDVPLGERLARALGLDLPITVLNDADAGMLAEHRRGAAVGVDDALYISGEVGVGGGAIVGGQPLHRQRRTRRRDRPHDRQPGRGRLPLRRARLLGDRGRRGTCSCAERATRRMPGWPASTRSSREAAAGSPEALGRARATSGAGSASASAALVNILNPRLIVLGGVHARMYPVVRDVVDAEVARRSLAAPRAEVRIVPATLGVDAPLVGAAELAFEPLLADPAAWLADADRAHRARGARDVGGRPRQLDQDSKRGTRACRMKGVA